MPVALLIGSRPVDAQDRLTGAQCVARATQLAVAGGAVAAGEPWVEFLTEKESVAHQFTLPRAGCVGFLAVGHGLAKDIDLALHASTGVMLAQDAAQDAHPYVRYCGAAGLSVYVVMQMYEGRGEVTLLSLFDAPAELRALTDALKNCGEGGPDLTQLIDVGPEPAHPALAESYAFVRDRLSQLGYRPDQVLLDDTLPERRRETREINLKPGSCYALAAVGDTTVEDLDLRVMSVGNEPVVLAEDTSRAPTALVKLCPTDAPMTLDVRMYQGNGRYQVHAFVSGSPVFSSMPVGLDGSSRIGFTEISYGIARRGMRPESMTWALAEPGERMALPITVTGGRCYAIGAVVGPELAGADLDLRVTDGAGRLLAWELGSSDQPLVFHCPATDQVLHVLGEVHGARAPGRFLVIVAGDGESSVIAPHDSGLAGGKS
jgi:hypothetical protein